MARVVLAMSGGVDSSVAAHLLLEEGHEVIGVFMRHGEESSEACRVDESSGNSLPIVNNPSESPNGRLFQQRADHKQGCCTASDAADARRVALKMSIPFYAVDLQSDFKRIVDYFVDDYLNGRTPNPCVKCNHWIKFGRLFDYADDVGAEFVATGHYARKATEANLSGSGNDHTYQLLRGLDSDKDQSYALFGIQRERLRRMLLPVGWFEKPKIREMAENLGLGVAGKKDSQEICFVTQGHHSDFVRAKAPNQSRETAGNFVDINGTVLGQHQGYEAFTIGQRKGLGIALGEPVFVTRIDPSNNDVVLGKKESLARQVFEADEANWLVDDPHHLPSKLGIQIRYNGEPKPGRILLEDDLTRFKVEFDRPELAVAPGQAAVIYDGPRVLGGGWIC